MANTLWFTTTLSFLALLAPEVSSQETCQASPVGKCTIAEGTINNASVATCTNQFAADDNSTTLRSDIVRNCDNVFCRGEFACWDTFIASPLNLQCLGTDSCGGGSIIYNVQGGGRVDCIGDQACDQAHIASTEPFNLTCRGGAGEACPRGYVRNPGGAVFCHGGTTGVGQCHDLQITKSVGCIICGSVNACKDVVLVEDDFNSTVTSTVPNDQVWVHPECSLVHVLDFLNKFHSAGVNAGPSCDDIAPQNGICDVVDNYCANSNILGCTRRFQHEWRWTDGQDVVIIDDKDDDNDNGGRWWRPGSGSSSDGDDDDNSNDNTIRQIIWIVAGAAFLCLVISSIGIGLIVGANLKKKRNEALVTSDPGTTVLETTPEDKAVNHNDHESGRFSTVDNEAGQISRPGRFSTADSASGQMSRSGAFDGHVPPSHGHNKTGHGTTRTKLATRPNNSQYSPVNHESRRSNRSVGLRAGSNHSRASHGTREKKPIKHDDASSEGDESGRTSKATMPIGRRS